MTKLEKRAEDLVEVSLHGARMPEVLEALRLTRVEAIEEALERFELAFERNEVVQDTLEAIRAILEDR